MSNVDFYSNNFNDNGYTTLRIRYDFDLGARLKNQILDVMSLWAENENVMQDLKQEETFCKYIAPALDTDTRMFQKLNSRRELREALKRLF